jgi:GldL N-terminal domain
MSFLILSIHCPTCLNRPLPDMIAASIDDNYERIKADLVGRGLTYERLMDDMLDHVCCLVEERMEEGEDFESSYQQILDTIGDKRLPEIQHQTLLNLDKKFQRMKNFTYLFGLTSAILTILGSFFKKMHWPGAGIMITVGMVLIVLVFLPLYFITNHREQVERKNPVYAIVGYLTIALLLAGATFKIMHWPGAAKMLYASVGFLLIGFVPLYVVNVFQRSGKEKANLPYIVMLLVGIASVMLMSNINMSKDLLDIYLEEALANEERVEVVQKQTADMLVLAGDSAHTDLQATVSRIHDQARDLQVMLNEMQEGMIVFVGQPGVSIDQVKGKDNKQAGRAAMLEHGEGITFMQEAKQYAAMLDELVKDPVARTLIGDHLEFTSLVWDYEHGYNGVADSPLMKNYFKNTDAAKGIALAEYVAITHLLYQ